MAILPRFLEKKLENSLQRNQVTAILGARQVGKSTLARILLEGRSESTIYLDLERPSHKAQLQEPEDFFLLHQEKVICLDEIQRVPELFPVIRSVVDDPAFLGRFLVLGSASPELLRQSSESLAGRIAYWELTPFRFRELPPSLELQRYFLRGGFPRAVLSDSDEEAFEWIENFVLTFLERDLSQMGHNIPPEHLRRLWTMVAHLNGQLLNYSTLSRSMGLSQKTIKHYLYVLEQTFMLRILQPYYLNTRKRLVKTPKVYIRDTGIVHALLSINTSSELLSHPTIGSSWEIMVIENILANHPRWKPFFFRTSTGIEVDLILTRGKRIIAIEVKNTRQPKLGKGFWNALELLKPESAYVVAPVERIFPYRNDVMVYPLEEFLAIESF